MNEEQELVLVQKYVRDATHNLIVAMRLRHGFKGNKRLDINGKHLFRHWREFKEPAQSQTKGQ